MIRNVPAAAWLPIVWALMLTGAFAVPFRTAPWPFIDLYSNLSTADSLTWAETLRSAFRAGVEYRPLLTLVYKLAYEVAGLYPWIYKAVILLQFAAILGVLIWMFRVASMSKAIAATTALSCIAGLHTSRVLFMFNPLNAHSAVLLLVIVAAALALEPGMRRWDWVYFPLTLIAVLLLESGLLIVPVVGVLWFVRAPGVSVRAVVACVAAAAVYGVIRLGAGQPVDPAAAYTHSGLGFSGTSPERLDEIFGHAPWLFWAYNVSATVFTVAFSEPREGTYKFIESLTQARTPVWMWLHVATSVMTTAVVLCLPRLRRALSSRDRHITAAALTLIVSGSALSFLYTRDRTALSVGVGYAMLLYVALGMLLARATASRLRTAAVGALTICVALGWLVRDAETYVYIREMAWEHHREWSVRFEAIRARRPESELLQLLRADVLEETPASPHRDPQWTYQIFERKFDRQNEPTDQR